MKVLLVEDYEMIRHVQRELIVGIYPNAKVVEASSLQEAERALSDGDFEFAILDQNVIGGNANQIALKLNTMGVSYLRYVGEPETLPLEVQGLGVIAKGGPGSWERLREAIRQIG